MTKSEITLAFEAIDREDVEAFRAFFAKFFRYDPDTGDIAYVVDVEPKKAGDSAIHWMGRSGYKSVYFSSRYYRYAHRLAFLAMTGNWPKHSVDHINGNPADNRFCNLRDVTHQFNQQNRTRPTKHNRLGILGVSAMPNKSGTRYKAKLSLNYKTIYLGTFDSILEAQAAYIEAKRRLHLGNSL